MREDNRSVKVVALHLTSTFILIESVTFDVWSAYFDGFDCGESRPYGQFRIIQVGTFLQARPLTILLVFGTSMRNYSPLLFTKLCPFFYSDESSDTDLGSPLTVSFNSIRSLRSEKIFTYLLMESLDYTTCLSYGSRVI